jgi:DNA-damage-inducible protein J
MAANPVVRARIDEHIKEDATAVLASMGLTISDAVRILLTRVASERTLPFNLTPNLTTIAAMKEARKIGKARFATADLLFDDLEKAASK